MCDNSSFPGDTSSLTWPESVSLSPGSLVCTSSGCSSSSSKITSFVSCTLRFCHCSVNMRNMCYFAFACFSIWCLNNIHKLMTIGSKLPGNQVMNNSMIHSIIHNLVAGQFAFSWKLASIEIMSAGRWLSNSIVSYLSLTDENTNCLVWFPNPLAVRWSQMRTLSTDCLGPDFSLCTIIRSKLKGIVTFGITTRIEHTQSMALSFCSYFLSFLNLQSLTLWPIQHPIDNLRIWYNKNIRPSLKLKSYEHWNQVFLVSISPWQNYS